MSSAVAAGIDTIRLAELARAATPGKWMWAGNAAVNSLYLCTVHSGRRFVMQFARWGFNGAQPVFQPRRNGMVKAQDLLQFEVGSQEVVGTKQANEDPSVYRLDIRGIANCPDAAWIAAADPTTILALIEELEHYKSLATR